MASTKRPSARTTAGRPQFRRIFLEKRRERHSMQEASALLRIDKAQLEIGVLAGQYEAVQSHGRPYFTWTQLVAALLDHWPLRTIYAELGADAPRALPALLQMRALTVVLPEYQVLMLQALAARAGSDIDSFLSDHLLDLAEAEADDLENEIPGFDAALRFPDEE